jgi:hypothetical protein
VQLSSTQHIRAIHYESVLGVEDFDDYGKRRDNNMRLPSSTFGDNFSYLIGEVKRKTGNETKNGAVILCISQ